MILYILLSGVPPFWGETEQQIFDSILKGHIDFHSDPWPNISTGAKNAVKAMLQQVQQTLDILQYMLCIGGGLGMISMRLEGLLAH